MFSAKRILGLAVLPATIVAIASPGVPPVQERVKISGTFTMAYLRQERVEVPDVGAHVLAVTLAQGSNRNTGPSDFMSGSQVTIAEMLDLVQGSGSSQGYVVQSKGPDSVFVRANGQVTTTLSPQRSPITTVRGDWTFVKGAGQYNGIRGRGTFKVGFTSESEFTVDWQGEYSK